MALKIPENSVMMETGLRKMGVIPVVKLSVLYANILLVVMILGGRTVRLQAMRLTRVLLCISFLMLGISVMLILHVEVMEVLPLVVEVGMILSVAMETKKDLRNVMMGTC
jgi:hypothetical protein